MWVEVGVSGVEVRERLATLGSTDPSTLAKNWGFYSNTIESHWKSEARRWLSLVKIGSHSLS
jgi:hypothetical protein